MLITLLLFGPPLATSQVIESGYFGTIPIVREPRHKDHARHRRDLRTVSAFFAADGEAMKFALRHLVEPRGSPHRVRQSQRQPLHEKELINGRQGEEDSDDDIDAELSEKSAPLFVL